MAWLLVAGAKSDVARAVAAKFAQNGFNIYLAARNYDQGVHDGNDLEIRYGVKTAVVEFNALDYAAHQAIYDVFPEKPLGVVCAVGYLGDQKKAETDFGETRKIIESNFMGCVSLLNIVARDFEQRKEGFIIGISSVAGDRGRQSNYTYGSAKAAFSVYLSGLRNRLSHYNVRVITVKPGFINTKMTEGMQLPRLLTAEPADVAQDIFRAYKSGKDIVYTKWFWKWIMLAIRAIPERIFKKMNL
ncbi:MAG: SDR family oxidoreductase [Dissulfurispiraceae bacterium]